MKAFKIIWLVLLSAIISLIIDQYLFCPAYTFDNITPFSGDSIYNPYADAVGNKWVKCNFHAHDNCWDGITNGKGSSNDIYNKYNNLHYIIHAISNYQRIDTTHHYLPNYISSYEHGYNILKSHQLVLGANTVCWKDYFFPQTLNNKQHIIYCLHNASPNGLVIINHPMLRGNYSVMNLKYLTGYSCMEVLHPSGNSSVLWDAALSAGRPVFIVGDDDCHNVFDSTKVGRICTWVNVPALSESNVLQSLRKGNCYAVSVGKDVMRNERKGDDSKMPSLQQFMLKGNSIQARFSIAANEITVSGKNGHLLYRARNTNTVLFTLGKSEPYARITANYKDGTQILLNPVFRYTESPLLQSSASINTAQTSWRRLAGMAVLATWFGFLLKPFLPRKQQNKLPNLSPEYEYISNLNTKNSKVWYGRPVWYFRRFFYNQGFERKDQTK